MFLSWYLRQFYGPLVVGASNFEESGTGNLMTLRQTNHDCANGESFLSSEEFDVWNRVASDLRTIGVATVDLPPFVEEIHAHAFDIARCALQRVHDDPSSVDWIAVDADSAHATGYHTAGGDNSLSRYNAHREGFVFSDNDTLEMKSLPEFVESMEELSTSLHTIANHALAAIERQLDISEGWFQQAVGPTRSSSQFHIKRYVIPCDESSSPGVENDDDAPRILLPMHTDPSLISVIVHDVPGRNPLAMGLEYYCPRSKKWLAVPFHGHAVAVIFVGSVLSYMTGNAFPSIKHRVVQEKYNNPNRVAATLFVRPQLEALLVTPPNAQRFVKTDTTTKQKQPVTFSTWISRVSRNYSKKEEKSKASQSHG